MYVSLQNNSAVGTINKTQVFSIVLPSNHTTKGFVGLGTAEYGMADFDNLRIDTAKGGLDWMKKKIKYIQPAGGKYKNMDSEAESLDEKNKVKIKDENSVTKTKEIDIVKTFQEEVILDKLDINGYKEMAIKESETLYFKSLKDYENSEH